MIDKSELDTLFRYALALCQDRDEAYDLLYSNIEKLLNPGKNIQPVNNKMAFMKRCIRNSYFDIQRHKKIRLIKSDTLQNEHQALQQQLESLEESMIKQQEVEHLLEGLKSEERELLYLWAVEGYTAQEIADLQGGGRGTWLSRMHRIKAKLRNKWIMQPSQKRGKQ
ncbi:MAG: sigma-70 family RNA polymerase sigma factor [Candidatus Polarisedimenticolaceae bacterium]|nr:sigma-70 family RNA polymerase sigma factor [Candidatus Polarisedimenticolaceae bacterium]